MILSLIPDLPGRYSVGIEAYSGRIAKAFVYSDAMDEAFIEIIPTILKGSLFNSKEMSQALLNSDLGQDRAHMARDIANWLGNKGF